MKLFDTAIKHSTYIKASPEKVFDTLTSAEGWNAWFTHGMTLDLKVGGVIHFKWKDGGSEAITAEDKGVVLEFQRPSFFKFNWHPQGKDHPTTVAFTIKSNRDGTLLSIDETGYLDTPEGHKWFNNCATGWGEAMTLLKFYLERNISTKSI